MILFLAFELLKESEVTCSRKYNTSGKSLNNSRNC